MSSHNVDDLLLGLPKPAVAEKPEGTTVSAEPDEQPEKLSYMEQFKKDKEEVLASKGQEIEENVQNYEGNDPEIENEPEKSRPVDATAAEVDDYGNELPKERFYTEKEVQQMIRDRLSRGNHGQEQPTQQQVTKAAEGFAHDPNSEESWDVQLDRFIDNKLDRRERETSEKQWKETEQKVQAEFESKFTTGMQKYKDFHEVTAGKPITNGMMLAARSMENPAAFIYAAAKQMPKELERIAALPDTHQQAAEMGKLEVMMRKAKTISKAPRPVSKTRGDLGGKTNDAPSLDERIHSYGKNRTSRR